MLYHSIVDVSNLKCQNVNFNVLILTHYTHHIHSNTMSHTVRSKVLEFGRGGDMQHTDYSMFRMFKCKQLCGINNVNSFIQKVRLSVSLIPSI